MRQKMKKNVPNCCLTLMKYLNLHLSTLKELKNAKKVKWDRPTDQPTDRQTDKPTYRRSCRILKINDKTKSMDINKSLRLKVYTKVKSFGSALRQIVVLSNVGCHF